MFVHLSHKISQNAVAFPGEPVLKLRQDRKAGVDGYPFNAYIMELPNYFGTHMDGPHHFNTTGANFDELPMEYFVYMGDEVLVVDLPHKCKPGEIITKEDVEPFAEDLKGKGLLLLRTGFEKYRTENPEIYKREGLAIHTELAKWLAQEFPDLRCVGMDWLSVASPLNDHGPEAHHWLLGNYTDHLITAVEDMSMVALGDSPKFKLVTMGPLRIEEVDSAQVNIIAWLED